MSDERAEAIAAALALRLGGGAGGTGYAHAQRGGSAGHPGSHPRGSSGAATSMAGGADGAGGTFLGAVPSVHSRRSHRSSTSVSLRASLTAAGTLVSAAASLAAPPLIPRADTAPPGAEGDAGLAEGTAAERAARAHGGGRHGELGARRGTGGAGSADADAAEPLDPLVEGCIFLCMEAGLFGTPCDRSQALQIVPHLAIRSLERYSRLYREGTVGKHMYIVLRGQVHLKSFDGGPDVVVGVGACVGEEALWCPIERKGVVGPSGAPATFEQLPRLCTATTGEAGATLLAISAEVRARAAGLLESAQLPPCMRLPCARPKSGRARWGRCRWQAAAV